MYPNGEIVWGKVAQLEVEGLAKDRLVEVTKEVAKQGPAEQDLSRDRGE
jgi:hypothetical protein